MVTIFGRDSNRSQEPTLLYVRITIQHNPNNKIERAVTLAVSLTTIAWNI